MVSPLKVLIVEDSLDDADLILRELRRAEFDPDSRRVDTEAEFLASLHAGLDIIISDYLMPGFNGLQALELLKRQSLEIPFIIVSGRIGEDQAVAAMQQGAADYLMKDRLARLGQAVRRAMQQARARAEQKRAEQLLQASEVLFRTSFENATAGVCLVATDGRFLNVNRTLCDMLGYTKEELLQLTFDDITHDEDKEIGRTFLANALVGGPKAMQIDKRYLRKDGQVVWALLSTALIERSGEHDAFMISNVQDITQRKQAESELEHSNLRLNLAVASGQLGVWEWDLFDDLLVWDERMRELYGVSATKFGSNYQEWANSVHPEDRARAEESLQAAIRGERPYDEEFRVVHPNGETRYIKANGIVVRDDQDRGVRVIGLNRDITDLKRSRIQQEELSAQLAQAQKMESIGRLAGGVAHDFNNLLTVINGHSRMALQNCAPGEHIHYQLEQIQEAGKLAAALTRQLLAFSRKQILRPSVLHLNAIVKHIESILSRLVGEDVRIEVSLSPEDPCVYADPHQLEQVLMNLAVNARDAMPGGGTLFIETYLTDRDGAAIKANPETPPGRYVVLAVSDTGVGMDEATRARIFEPFFTTKAVGEGTGMGLSTVQGIVAQSGGCVNVYSEPGKGSTFRISLPALTEAGATIGPAPASNDLNGKETVLVVEDQKEVRNFTVQVLERYGYRVLQAAGAQEALALCDAEVSGIHLLLTDVVMPEMSGPDLAARVAKVIPEIKTLFMSGYTENVVVRHGLPGGQGGVVEKPFTPEQLAVSVRNLLRVSEV